MLKKTSCKDSFQLITKNMNNSSDAIKTDLSATDVVTGGQKPSEVIVIAGQERTEYKLQDLDELYGYMWLKPDITNINADIFVDDGEAYIRDNHVPLLFVRNGLGREITTFIPISISEKPTILDTSIVISIDFNIIKQIIEFIKVNTKTLMAMANGKISSNDFVSALIQAEEQK